LRVVFPQFTAALDRHYRYQVAFPLGSLSVVAASLKLN